MRPRGRTEFLTGTYAIGRTLRVTNATTVAASGRGIATAIMHVSHVPSACGDDAHACGHTDCACFRMDIGSILSAAHVRPISNLGDAMILANE
jgi:hypothetical protein